VSDDDVGNLGLGIFGLWAFFFFFFSLVLGKKKIF
jgi:hypothetical protein